MQRVGLFRIADLRPARDRLRGTEGQPDAHMPYLDDKFKSRVGFTILAITVIALAICLVWIGRVIFLLLFAAIVGAILLNTISGWLHRRLKIKRGPALALFI